MAIVLREGAHAHDAMERARGLVAVAGAELREAERQVAIALESLAEDLHRAGTIHRLEGEDALVPFILVLHREHVLPELFPVSRGFPERAVDELRRLHLDIAIGLEPPSEIPLDHSVKRPALGMPEDAADRLLLLMEEVELAAQPAVVALLGLFELMQIGVELFLIRECRAVDALQLLVLGVTAPIGARHLHHLEGVAELARRGEVRTRAEIDELSLPVDADLLVLRDLLDPFRLVLLADRLEEAHGVVARPDLARDRLVAVDDLVHALLELREILGREGMITGKIVVEPRLRRGTEGHLDVREQFLGGFRHRVRGVVAQQLQSFRRGARDDCNLGVAVDDRREVFLGAVDLERQRRLGQAGTDCLGELRSRDRARKLAHGAVGQSDGEWRGGIGRHESASKTLLVCEGLGFSRRRAWRQPPLLGDPRGAAAVGSELADPGAR